MNKMQDPMANRHRGEIEAELGGETYVLCLTLVNSPNLKRLWRPGPDRHCREV